jgi:RHS repeat-associated protein
MGIFREIDRFGRWIAIAVCAVLLSTLGVTLPIAAPAASATPLPPTEVVLSTDKLFFDAGSTYTLTATVDQPLEDTSSTLTISDETNSASVKQCTSGLECEIELSFTSGGPREYVATVNSLTSDVVEVARSSWTIELSADDSELAAGESTFLRAEANQDVSLTDGSYAIAIFDTTRGERIETCTSSATCDVEVDAYKDSISSTDYVAVVLAASDSTSATPESAEEVQASSAATSVSRAPWVLEASSGVSVLAPGEETWVSVEANQDLDDTNGLYSIYIFEMSKDLFIAQCDSGTTCAEDVSWAQADPYGGYFMAFLAERMTTPPTSYSELVDQAGWSNMAMINVLGWEAGLTAGATELAAGDVTTLSATVNQDLGETDDRYALYIVEWVNDEIIASCTEGSTCSMDFWFWYLGDDGYAGRSFAAIVGAPGATGATSNITAWKAASDSVFVSRVLWEVELERTSTRTFTLTTNQDAAETNGQWAWYLMAGPFGSEAVTVDACYSGLRCVVRDTSAELAQEYTVVLARTTEPAGFWDIEDQIADSTVYLPPATPVGPTLGPARPGGPRESTGGRNRAQCASQCGRADPVNTATGDFYLPATDLGIDGTGPVLALSRTYSVSATGLEGPFGFGWVPNFGAALHAVVPSDDSNALPRQVEIVQENGGTLLFTRDGVSSDYVAPARILAHLEFDGAEDLWVLTRKTNEILKFNLDGQLLSVGDPDGNELTFDYAGGVLESISASGGRSIELTWSDGRVTSATDSAFRTVTYDYDGAGDLVSYTAADLSVTGYEYDADHRMTAQIAPGGARTENTFDEAGRVVSQEDPIGRVTTFDYDEVAGTTTITAPDGIRTVDQYANGLLVSQTLAEGTAAEAITQYSYNEVSQISEVLDPLGGLTTFAYDSSGNRLSTVDQLNRETEWTYGAGLSPLTTTDAEGRVSTFTYNSAGRPLTSETNSGSTETWTYNADGTVATYEDATGAETVYDYDSAGRLVETTDAENRSTVIDYNAAGLPNQVTGSDGHTTVTTYDAAGRILEVEDPNGNSTTYTYDAAGNIASETNAEAETTTFTYDAAGQLLTTTDPEGGITVLTYDLGGNVASATDPNGNTTSSTYDHYGNVLTSTDALGRVTTNTYDLRGLLTSITLPSGALTTYERDAAGQVVEVTDALGNVTTVEYNLVGQPVLTEDPLGRVATTSYDLDGRVEETVLPDLSTQAYEYDEVGNITSFTNADGLETTYTYTDTGLLASRIEPGGLQTDFAYDSGARLALKTRPDASEVEYTYDASGQLEGIDYIGTTTSDATYTYDDAGRMVTIIDGTGTTTLTYDNAGRLTSETDGSGDILEYAYDDGGRLTTITYPGSREVTYAYDIGNQLTSITDWSSRTTSFTWTLDGLLDTQTSPNGVVQDFGYDLSGQITGIEIETSAASIAAFGYVRDDVGQITAQTAAFATSTLDTEFEHDLLGQLSGIERDNSVGPPTSFDTAATSGGLLVTTDDRAELTYNAAQQVIERDPTSGPTITYAYDNNGARSSATQSSPAASTTYSYDPAGVLAEVDLPTRTVAYETDARGLRQTRTSSSTEDYLWSTARSLSVLMMDGNNLYVYGPSPTPIAQIDQSTDEASYLHTDLIGSVRATTDETGATLGTQTFTEFGSPLSSTGSTGTPFGFTGNWTDQDTGMIHLRARDYDPTTGQFISVDPALEDTRQPYTYAGNDPIQFTDHTGLDFWSDLATNALAFGAGVLNGVTMGVSGAIMSAVVPGYDCFVEANSGYYGAGDVVGMVGSTIALSAISAGSLGAAAVGARLAITAAARTVAAGVRVTSAAIARTTASVGARFGAAKAPTVSSLLRPGQYATKSIPARGPAQTFTSSERKMINEIGETSGCHSCGTRVPGTKSGNFVPDHQPPTALARKGEPQSLYPQCLSCSKKQGLEIAGLLRKGEG